MSCCIVCGFGVKPAFLLVLSALLLSIGVGQEHEEPERAPNDGWFNNLLNPNWGAIDTILLRMTKAAYADGSYEPSGKGRPNPLEISQVAFKGDDSLGSLRNRTALLVYFGQQLVEELVDAQRPGCPREYFNIKVPRDHLYNPHGKDNLEMPFLRSRYDQRTGHSPNNPRQQLNEITPYIDGNLFYGAGKAWEDALRSFKDGQLLATSTEIKEMLPVPNDIKLPFANPPSPRDHVLRPVKRFRRYGNPRTHENPFLNALGIVWFRYHNYVAKKIKEEQPTFNDEQLFNAARKRVIAQYQKIVMYEWLPAWLNVTEDGEIIDIKSSFPYEGGQLSKYHGYEPTLHPGVSVEFQAAAMRYGHTLVPSVVRTRTIKFNACASSKRDVPLRYTTNKGNNTRGSKTTASMDSIRLCNSFWVPEETLEGDPGVSSLILGMMYTRSAREDHVIVSDIRENTFGPLEWSRRDLGALNIQRGRDHGLSGYNDVREAYGLARATKWEDISQQPEAQPVLKNLSSLYGSQVPDDLDFFPGGLLETTPNGPGPLFYRIILDQFLRIRHGDRFWYENRENKLFDDSEIGEIEKTTFYDVLESVTGESLGGSRKNVFICTTSVQPLYGCRCFDPVAEGQDVTETCEPLRHYDYFEGSAPFYILVVIYLFLCIIVTCAIMYGMAQRRQHRLASARGQRTGAFSKPANPNQFYATEWVGKTRSGLLNCRDVLVELNPNRLKIFVSNISGHVVRMIDIRKRSNWSEGQSRVFMRSSCDKQYRLLIFTIPGEIDLALHFQTQHERESAIAKLDEFFQNHGWSIDQGQPMAEHLMWRDATTVDQRKEILAKFFRGVLKELFQDGGQSSPEDEIYGNVAQTEEDVMRTKLTRTEFADALGLQPQSLFVRNMFLLADTDGEGFVSFDEFKTYFGVLCSGSQSEKAEMFFKMFDTSRAGRMTKDNYKNMIRSISEMNDSGGAAGLKDLNDMVDMVFKGAGLDKQGYMTINDFKKVFFSDSSDVWKTAIMNMELNGQSMGNMPKLKRGRPTMVQRTTSVFMEYQKSVKTPLSSMSVKGTPIDLPSQQAEPVKSRFQIKYRLWTRYIDNHWRQIFWLSLYILVLIGIFVERVYYFSKDREHAGLRRITSYGVSVTRGAASAQMFTFASLLITMCRNIITYLRETFLHYFIPFDSAYDMHKCIGWLAVFSSVVHIVGHMFNFYQVSTQPSTDMNCYFREFFRSSDTLASFQYWFFQTITGLTGWVLTTLLVIMIVFSVPYARRNLFQHFAMTHNLSFFVFTLMFLHGAGRLVQEPFWGYFFLGPLLLFVFDKLVSYNRNKVLIPVQKATLLPSEVTNLVFKRPQSFNYQSGQWVRIACPNLGASEYHPFTLTSSPHEDFLSLHIRAVGPWTNNLRALFRRKTPLHKPIKLYLDGPFGESHQDWHRFPVSVLIGAGIGITPFASILKDIAQNFKSASLSGRIPCKKVYFLWVTRTQRSFEWMTDIIQQVEAADTADFVDMEICITQMKDKFDLRTAMLYVCERHFQKIAGVSLFTGLRARTHFGRPKFPLFFRALKNEHPNVSQIGVFSCGPPALTRNVSVACRDANSYTGPALISYHENF